MNNGVRLSCRVRVTEDLVVELPEASHKDAVIMTDGNYDTALNLWFPSIILSCPGLP